MDTVQDSRIQGREPHVARESEDKRGQRGIQRVRIEMKPPHVFRPDQREGVLPSPGHRGTLSDQKFCPTILMGHNLRCTYLTLGWSNALELQI